MELLIHGARSEFRQCKESAVVGRDATEPSGPNVAAVANENVRDAVIAAHKR